MKNEKEIFKTICKSNENHCVFEHITKEDYVINPDDTVSFITEQPIHWFKSLDTDIINNKEIIYGGFKWDSKGLPFEIKEVKGDFIIQGIVPFSNLPQRIGGSFTAYNFSNKHIKLLAQLKIINSIGFVDVNMYNILNNDINITNGASQLILSDSGDKIKIKRFKNINRVQTKYIMFSDEIDDNYVEKFDRITSDVLCLDYTIQSREHYTILLGLTRFKYKTLVLKIDSNMDIIDVSNKLNMFEADNYIIECPSEFIFNSIDKLMTTLKVKVLKNLSYSYEESGSRAVNIQRAKLNEYFKVTKYKRTLVINDVLLRHKDKNEDDLYKIIEKINKLKRGK